MRAGEPPPGAILFWRTYPRQIQATAEESVYAEVLNRCKCWRVMKEPERPTTAHECAHGIHAEIRNAIREPTAIAYTGTRGPDGHRVFEPNPLRGMGFCNRRRLEHVRDIAWPARAGELRVNIAFSPPNRYVVLPEPIFRKVDVASRTPGCLRGYRYATYLSGQRDWDDRPLYLWDEWAAYQVGAAVGLDDVAAGRWRGEWTDLVSGLVEFSLYVAVLMTVALERQDPAADYLISPFVAFWRLAQSLYLAGREKFPFAETEKLLDALAAFPQAAWVRGGLERLGVSADFRATVARPPANDREGG